MRQNTHYLCFDAFPFYFRLYSLIAFLYSATAIFAARCALIRLVWACVHEINIAFTAGGITGMLGFVCICLAELRRI